MVEKFKGSFRFENSSQVSIEADPGTFDQRRLHNWYLSGINRLSVGVQSFSDEILSKSGRAHSVADVHRALNDIKQSPFTDFSLDLISSLPYSKMEGWRETLITAIKYDPPHISIYDLQIGEKTAFSSWYTPGTFPLPSKEESVLMYTIAQDNLQQAGYDHYEVSNYAKTGFRSRHNQKYWHCVPTLAFGMGASSYFGGKRFTRPEKLQSYYSWVDKIAKDPKLLLEDIGRDVDDIELIDGRREDGILKHFDSHTIFERPKPDLLEFVMLQLRTKEGIDLDQIQEMYGCDISSKIVFSLSSMVGSTIIREKSNIRIKDPEGFLVSNDIISNIFVALDT